MSEFTNKQAQRNSEILSFSLKIIKGENPSEAVKQSEWIMNSITYEEVITLTDSLMDQGLPMHVIKKGVNKILNLFYKTLNSQPTLQPLENSFLDYLMQNNRVLDQRLKKIKPLLRAYAIQRRDKALQDELRSSFDALQKFDNQYVIKENILFPVLEKSWRDFRCVQIMWSFHDDIRRNLKSLVAELSNTTPDMKKVNRFAGDVFFNMYAIKFREEKILFPRVLETISPKVLNNMLSEGAALPWPFVSPDRAVIANLKPVEQPQKISRQTVDLQTGSLLPEQIRWMMKHLPVDVTYVDENNKVRYFSTPKERIFPRTLAVIDRDVRNCHPHESVHVVEKIIDAFRKGEKEHADFWIQMKGKFVYIRYFAIHDEEGIYKGVLEVSQEVSEIKKLEGEKKLLNWEE